MLPRLCRETTPPQRHLQARRTAPWVSAHYLLAGILRQLFGHPGGDEPGRQCVDRDLSGRHLPGYGLGEADEPGLGCGVVGLARIAAYADHRGDVDHAAAVLPYQVGQDVLGAKEGAPQVNFQYLVPLIGGHAEQQAVAVDAGVVDQDVDALPPFNELFDCGFGKAVLGNVPLQENGFAAGGRYVVHYRGGGGAAEMVVDGHLGAGPGQTGGDGRADSPGCSRHQGYLAR